MIDAAAGVEVRIHPHGSLDRYPEWAPVEKSPLKVATTRKNAAFIVPVLEERFTIEVILHPTFDFMGQTWARVTCNLGSTVPELVVHFSNPNQDPAAYKTPSTQQHTFETVEQYLKDSIEAFAMEWSTTKHDRHVTVASEDHLTPLSYCGRIIVNIVRGKKIGSTTIMRKPLTEARSTTKGTSPQLIKNEQFVASREKRSIGIKLMSLSKIQRKPFSPHEPILEKAEKEVGFTYYYASNAYLETHDIIPDVSKPRSRALSGQSTSNGGTATASSSPKHSQPTSDTPTPIKKPYALRTATKAASGATPAKSILSTPESAKRSFSQMSTPTHQPKLGSLADVFDDDEDDDEPITKTRRTANKTRQAQHLLSANPGIEGHCTASEATAVKAEATALNAESIAVNAGATAVDANPDDKGKLLKMLEIRVKRLELDVEEKKLGDADTQTILELENKHLRLKVDLLERKLYWTQRA